jgi:hypothetical protein
MLSRPLTQYILGLVFLVSSSFALSNTEFTFYNDGEKIEIQGCVDICPLNLIIPNQINDLPVKAIGEYAFVQNHLTSVYIPDTVTHIYMGAFMDNRLSSVIIPDNVVYIGSAAFESNLLIDVTLPSGLERIESSTFNENQISSIVLPNGINYIGSHAFSYNNLSEIVLPNSLMLIGADSFIDNSISNIVIPSSVISIDDRAFSQNPLGNVTFLGDRPEIGIEVVTSSAEIKFCENTFGWPGESLWLATPQQNYDCPENLSTPVNPIFNYSVFDMDRNGSVDALTDGLIMLRYFFGLREDNLVRGAVATDATRTSGEEIEAHIKSYLP